MDDIDAASMSRVCEEWVSGVLMTGAMRLTKLNASCGVHLGICMQVSHIYVKGLLYLMELLFVGLHACIIIVGM